MSGIATAECCLEPSYATCGEAIFACVQRLDPEEVAGVRELRAKLSERDFAALSIAEIRKASSWWPGVKDRDFAEQERRAKECAEHIATRKQMVAPSQPPASCFSSLEEILSHDFQGCPALQDAALRYPHEPKEWLHSMMNAGDGSSHPNMWRIKALRALIWLQTRDIVYGRCCIFDTNIWAGRKLQFCAQAMTEKKPLKSLHSFPRRHFGPLRYWTRTTALRYGTQTNTTVESVDMLEVAGRFVAGGGETVAVLNMASARTPGGGVWGGAGAQEENLHRRTDLCRHLMDQKKELYPLHGNKCLLSHDVLVFRGSEGAGYPIIEPFFVQVISCAAVRRPDLTWGDDYEKVGCQYANPADYDSMEAKLGTIIWTAEDAGVTVLIMSAFGCGAFGNPPEVVASIIQRLLVTSTLQRVVFCILNDHNSGCWHNPSGNLKPFASAFGITDDSSDDSSDDSTIMPSDCSSHDWHQQHLTRLQINGWQHHETEQQHGWQPDPVGMVGNQRRSQ